ncbi:MAG: FAD-dependent oxidoreductase [Chloroflexota bacterium]
MKVQILILGNGFAGISALETLRAVDRTLSVSLVAREPHPFYSPASLFAFLEGRVERQHLFLRPPEFYVQPGLKTFLGRRVSRLEASARTVLLDDGTRLPYDRLLLATGASARLPEIPGREAQGVFKLDTLADAEAIRRHSPRRAVVVGAGWIGVGLAAALAEQGAQVDLIEVAETILLGVFHQEVAAVIMKMLHDHGVQVRLGEKIAEIHGDPVTAVQIDKEAIPCDSVFLAVGRRPNLDFVDPAEVPLGPGGGVLVDDRLHAGQGIYAAGDCAEPLDFLGHRAIHAVIPTAIETGRIAALNMAGRSTPYAGSINANALQIFGQAFFSIGFLEGEKVLRRVRDRLHLFVLQGNRLVGAQFAGEAPEAAQARTVIRRGIALEGAFNFDALQKRLFLPVVFPNPNR